MDPLRALVRGVLPGVTPYQFAVYAFLLDRAHESGSSSIRIGKRAIAAGLGRGTRSSQGNLQHINEKLNELDRLGLIAVGPSDRLGTQITIYEPAQVAWVAEALDAATAAAAASERSYFTDPELRRELFARDGWRCRYCGAEVTDATVTLDHVIPRSKGGSDDPDNLATACHACNSVKSGRTEAEAAPLILARLRDEARRGR